MTSLRTSFRMRRASDMLAKVKDVATALALTTRLTPLSAVGLLAHLISFGVGVMHKDLASIAATWPRVTVDEELHKIVRDALLPCAIERDDEWSHCRVGEQAVLMHMQLEHYYGAFFAEVDPALVLAHVRDATWQRHGHRVALRPNGRWGESVSVHPLPPAAAHDSQRAREIWARVLPYLEVGEPRSLLLDGKPRTGKSTIVRRLLDLADARQPTPLRVMRVAVSDFSYLRPSVVEAAVKLLLPDAVVIDDIDRLGSGDMLLDFLENTRRACRMLLATSNDASKLTLAVRGPERFDIVEQVEGVGPELASIILGSRWAALPVAVQQLVTGWPAAYVRALQLTLQVEPGIPLDDAVAALRARVDAAPMPAPGAAPNVDAVAPKPAVLA